MTPIVQNPTHVQSVALCCPACAAELAEGDDVLDCPSCGSTYRVIAGLPRLSPGEPYWGLLKQSAARKLVDDAHSIGWKQAVADQFAPGDDGYRTILDWQRASWIPLLDLPSDSVVLDIGSGFGGITHALADYFNEVHSLEAVDERVEFTRARLDQAGRTNVCLVQGSALRLPYPPNSFDAIIVNGVLEWIGDWDANGSPREAQARFLRAVHRLLKPNGRLLVGIENRLSYASFIGAQDHSGLPFTSLLPRPIASALTLALPRGGTRTRSRTYRTYTYSERGYRKLFSETGFASIEPYWAEPGYNQPYRLTPLNDASVNRSLVEMQVDARPGPLTLSGRLKRVFSKAGIFRLFVPDFVFILHKGSAAPDTWRAKLPEAFHKKPKLLLTTYPFSEKTTIRAMADGARGVVVKCSTPEQSSRDRVWHEYSELEDISALVQQSPEELPFTVSMPLGIDESTRQLITMETRGLGEPIQKLFAPLGRDEQVALLRQVLPRLCASAARSATLRSARQQHRPAASWLTAVEEVVPPALAARARAIGDSYSRWMCHGDFTLENCLYHAESGTLTVIDWEFVRDGVPPLYDVVCVLLSVLNSVVPPEDVIREFDDIVLARFYTMLFHENEYSALVARCVSDACVVLGVEHSALWQMLQDCLLFRIGYLLQRGSGMAASRIRFITEMQNWKASFQL